jgi:hypothetical protein
VRSSATVVIAMLLSFLKTGRVEGHYPASDLVCFYQVRLNQFAPAANLVASAP